LLDVERVLTDELRLGRLQFRGIDPRPDARNSLIGLNLDDRSAADAPRGHGAWIPRRFHLAGFANDL
jgi:hypothetical protein